MNADPIRVSNIEKIYPYTGNAVSVVPTVHDADNDTTLTAGTDYDVTFSPAEVKDKGVYAVTISGKGGYSFTRTFNFLVATLDYIDENGATQTKTQGELTILTTRDSLPAALTGWYFVADNISFNDGVTVNGEAHLILADGTTMSANCIHVNSGNTLNIYGQTDGTGKLIATPGGLITYDRASALQKAVIAELSLLMAEIFQPRQLITTAAQVSELRIPAALSQSMAAR